MELPEIPVNKDITYLGLTTYRDKNQLFGIKRKDRRQHVYDYSEHPERRRGLYG
ncbi:MAG: hypothetical protein UU10_C0001G0002 [Parcubacteria group bacterium GW2011_GWF1_40_6]|nr:MAG: hypothetical protein UU10_C0001G0002 [Parcubacteria group bacterium GW2011_GWF1_40_6]